MTQAMKTNLPALRFKGFEKEWEEQETGSVLSERKRPVALADDESYELITVKRRNAGVTSRGHLLGKNILVKNYFSVREGDFVISKRQVVHGATGVIPHDLNEAIVSNEYFVCEESDHLTTGFLFLLSCLPRMKRDIFLSSYGVDIEKLFFDVEDWKKRTLVLPHKSEQRKIGRFFQQLDAQISQHQNQLDKLTQLKQVMLQKMFPQGDATEPEIRFKGFTEKWEKEHLENIAHPLSNNSLSRAALNYGTGFAKNIHYGDILIHFDNVLNANRPDLPFIADRNNIEKPNGSELKAGDIVFSDAAEDETVGKSVELVETGDIPVFAGLHTIAFRPIRDFASGYLGYYTNSESYRAQLYPLMQGTKVLSLARTAFKSTYIKYPKTLHEQQSISTYFLKLDELIILKHAQLDKLKQIKQACLRQMFA